MRRINVRSGFSLVELLVVFAILTIVAGLLFAAVQRIRLAALRVACSHQIRQVALALHQYHEVQLKLPPGTTDLIPTSENPERNRYPALHWPARVLPYLEQETLWRQIDHAFATDVHEAINTNPACLVRLAILNCPVDSVRVSSHKPDWPIAGSNSYLGVAGTQLAAENGVLFLNSQIRWVDVTDGLSNTLMLGERPPNLTVTLGRYYGGTGHWYFGDAILGVRETLSDVYCLGDPPFANTPLGTKCSDYHFWSLHSGGTHFALADGSVRFVSFSTSEKVLKSLATRAGGEPGS